MASATGILEVLKKLDFIESKMGGHAKILAEHSMRIEELCRKIEEHTRVLERLTATVSAIGARYGVSTEETS